MSGGRTSSIRSLYATTLTDHYTQNMDSDHAWFDVDVTMHLTIRTEGWSAADACQRVRDNLESITYNPGGWDDRELIGTPNIEILQYRFHPQGYRTEEPGP